MVLPLQAMQNAPPLGQQQPGQMMQIPDMGYMLPDINAFTQLPPGFELPIEASQGVLQQPPELPVPQGRRFAASKGTGGGVGTMLAIQQAQQDLQAQQQTLAPQGQGPEQGQIYGASPILPFPWGQGSPSEQGPGTSQPTPQQTQPSQPQEKPLTFMQRFAIGLNPALGQFYLQRLERQRKTQVGAHIQETYIEVDKLKRARKFDEAQARIAQTLRSAGQAPEFLPLLDNMQRGLEQARRLAGIRDILEKRISTQLEGAKSPHPALSSLLAILRDKKGIPDESLDLYIGQDVLGALEGSLLRSEFANVAALGVGTEFQPSRGEVRTHPFGRGYDPAYLKPAELTQLQLKWKMNRTDLQNKAANNENINPILSDIAARADLQEGYERLRELRPDLVPPGFTTRIAEGDLSQLRSEMAQLQEQVRGGQVEQKGQEAQSTQTGFIRAEQMTQPLFKSAPNAVVYDGLTRRRADIRLNQKTGVELRDLGWTVINNEKDIQAVDNLTDSIDAVAQLKKAYELSEEPTSTLAKDLLGPGVSFLERFWPAYTVGKEKSAAETARAVLQGMLDSNMFPKPGESFAALRRLIDSNVFSNKEAMEGALGQLTKRFEGQLDRIFSRATVSSGPSSEADVQVLPGRVEPSAPATPPSVKPGKPGTAKPQGSAAPKVLNDPDFAPPQRVK